jgi:hypothetical protein
MTPNDPMPVFTIKAKDALAVAAITAYRDLCTQHHLDDQAEQVQLALDEIGAWQRTHGDEMKLPDHKHVPAGEQTGPGTTAALMQQQQIERLHARIEQLIDYTPTGTCRGCGGREDRHHESCRLYVGPLTHEWLAMKWNETFGGVDHFCRCGGWFRQGGVAGHGDPPVCPYADQSWRGPQPAELEKT